MEWLFCRRENRAGSNLRLFPSREELLSDRRARSEIAIWRSIRRSKHLEDNAISNFSSTVPGRFMRAATAQSEHVLQGNNHDGGDGGFHRANHDPVNLRSRRES